MLKLMVYFTSYMHTIQNCILCNAPNSNHKVALVAIPRAGIRLKIEFYDKKSNLKRTHLEFRNDGDIYNIFAILKNHRVNIVYTPE